MADSALRRRISFLARQQMDLEDEVATLEETLKTKKALLRTISENDLPEAVELFEAADDEEDGDLTTPDGHKISLEREYYPGIRKGNAEEAVRWLRANGYGHAVKATVTVKFGMGEILLADRFIATVQKMYPGIGIEITGLYNDKVVADAVLKLVESAFAGVYVVPEYTVPAITLKNIVRKIFERGEKLPDSIECYSPLRATIVRKEEEARTDAVAF